MIKPRLRNGLSFSGMTIGLLGGSFNPAHEGHVAMSLYAMKRLGLDQVWWLVSPQNPTKSARGMAEIDTRLRQAERVAAHPRLVVTDLESEFGTCFTADTLRVLRLRFPKVRFVWLMGADNLRQIPHWSRWGAIFERVPLAVFRRPAYPAGRHLGKAAIRFDQGWQPAARSQTLAKTPPELLPRWIILDNKLNYTSATQIRKDNPSWQKQK